MSVFKNPHFTFSFCSPSGTLMKIWHPPQSHIKWLDLLRTFFFFPCVFLPYFLWRFGWLVGWLWVRISGVFFCFTFIYLFLCSGVTLRVPFFLFLYFPLLVRHQHYTTFVLSAIISPFISFTV